MPRPSTRKRGDKKGANGGQMGKNRDPRILGLEKPYIERERKFIPVVPPAIAGKGAHDVAEYKRRQLQAIAQHVRQCPDIFVTADHPDLAPVIPAALRACRFAAEDECTRPRERIYYVDAAMTAEERGVEFRQQTNRQGEVKQTIKIGRDFGQDDRATLNRHEMHARLRGPGVVLTATADKGARKWLTENFNEQALKPAFRMVSQRLRLPYFPAGDTDVMIELACDTILFGETIFGRCWQDPKLEIEILKGPADELACRRILEREEARLLSVFALAAQHESNAEMGYAQLRPDLETGEGRTRFDRLQATEIWWDRPGRGRWGLK